MEAAERDSTAGLAAARGRGAAAAERARAADRRGAGRSPRPPKRRWWRSATAALDAAQQARRAADLAERATAAALGASQSAADGAGARRGPAEDVALRSFSERADRVVARLRALERRPRRASPSQRRRRPAPTRRLSSPAGGSGAPSSERAGSTPAHRAGQEDLVGRQQLGAREALPRSPRSRPRGRRRSRRRGRCRAGCARRPRV